MRLHDFPCIVEGVARCLLLETRKAFEREDGFRLLAVVQTRFARVNFVSPYPTRDIREKHRYPITWCASVGRTVRPTALVVLRLTAICASRW